MADFRSEGLAERDAERRADRLIEEVFAASENGQAWLRDRIALCERAATRARPGQTLLQRAPELP